MTIKVFATALIVTFLLSACAASKKASTNAGQTPPSPVIEKYKTIATEKYKSDIDFVFNSNKSHVLCIKQAKPTNQNPHPALRFFIYELSKDEIVYEEPSTNGSVKWINDYRVQVSTIPGIVKGNERATKPFYGYVYDLKLRKRVNPQARDLKSNNK